jgi:hypothetical protein
MAEKETELNPDNYSNLNSRLIPAIFYIINKSGDHAHDI